MLWKTKRFEIGSGEFISYRVIRRFGRGFGALRVGKPCCLYWSAYEPKNFGDWITPYLYYKFTGRSPFFLRTAERSTTIFGSGSIFRHIKHPNCAVVWGSGVISYQDIYARPKEVLAVRGKRTATVLAKNGIICPDVFGDPGIVLPSVYQPKARTPRYRLGLIPHFRELPNVRTRLEEAISDEVSIIDPTQPIEVVIDSIAECEATVSSSLHGLIVSHAYRVPSGWVRFNPQSNRVIEGDDIKYFDYFSAFGLDERVRRFDASRISNDDIEVLYQYAKACPLPDQSVTADKLIKVCPFI